MSTKATRYRVDPNATIEDVDLDQTDVRLPDGRRLTEQLAGQLAEQTLARGVGRPSLSGVRGRPSQQIGLRLSPDLDRRLRERAAAEGKRPSQIVREALERYV